MISTDEAQLIVRRLADEAGLAIDYEDLNSVQTSKECGRNEFYMCFGGLTIDLIDENNNSYIYLYGTRTIM